MIKNRLCALFILAFTLTACLDETNSELKSVKESSNTVADQMQKLTKDSEKISNEFEKMTLYFEAVIKAFMQLTMQTEANAAIATSTETSIDFLKGEDEKYFAEKKPSDLITGRKCFRASAKQAFDSLIDYSKYHEIDNPKKETGVNAFIPKLPPPIDMVTSDAWVRTDSADENDAKLEIKLKPMLVEVTTLFPQATLRCFARRVEEGVYEQKCDLDNTQTRFALSEFKTRIKIKEKSEVCEGATQLDYVLFVESIPADVQKIKEAVVGKNPYINKMINSIFDEKIFFRNYFQSFYDNWLLRLQEQTK